MERPEGLGPQNRRVFPWGSIGLWAGLALGLYLLYLLRPILTPFLLAFILAYLLDPVVRALERGSIPRVGGTLIVMGCLGVVAVLAFAFIGPIVRQQIETAVQELPGYIDAFKAWIEPLMMRLGWSRSEPGGDVFGQFLLRLGDLPLQLLQSASPIIRATTSGLANLIFLIIEIAIVPVATFFLLRDFTRMKEAILHCFPPRHRGWARTHFGRVDEVLGSFIRGQLLVALTLGVLYTIGLLLVGAPFAILMGIVAGVASLVPYLSLVIALAPSLFLSFLQHRDFLHPLGVGLVWAVVLTLEGSLIIPLVMRNRVGLHPVIVLMALLVGGYLYGFFGLLLGVPAAAVIQVFLKAWIESYQETDFYRRT